MTGECSRNLKESKTRLLSQTLVWLYPIAVKESPGTTSTQLRITGRDSYSYRELLPRKLKKSKKFNSERKEECSCISQFYVSENKQRDALFIGTELYPLLIAPHKSSACSSWLQLMCNFTRSQIHFYRVKKRYKSKQWRTSGEWDRAREYSESKCLAITSRLQVLGKDLEVQVLGMIPSPCSMFGVHSESKYSGMIPRSSARESLRVQVLGSRRSEAGSYLRKTKNNFQNVAGPRNLWTKVHSCPQVVSAHLPNPAGFGSACARVWRVWPMT